MAASVTRPVEMKAGRWRRRTMTVVAAVIATIIVFLVETKGFGLKLASPALMERASAEVTIKEVIGASGAAGIWGWIVMAILERVTPRARSFWTVLAVITLIVSLAGAFAGEGITTNQRLALAALHLTTGVILIRFIPDWPPRRYRVAAQ